MNTNNNLFSTVQIYEFIKQHEPFNSMSTACLRKIAGVLEIESQPGDSLFIKQGEPSDDLYILLKGKLHYEVRNAEGDITYQGGLNEGSIIGEMAILSDSPRSANIYVLRDSILLKLSKKNFLKLSGKYPELLNKITQFTIKRLTLSLQGIRSTRAHNKSITLIPIKPIEHFEYQLQEMILHFPYGEKILLLTSSFMQKRKNFLDEKENLSNDAILWINQQESEYSFIFYMADETLTNWTKFCLRQADSIAFLVLAEEKDFSLSEVEEYLSQNNSKNLMKPTTLVFLHSDANLPKNTHHWLEKRAVNNYYHVRSTTEAGIARMMRIFTNNTISLVLSGGGARGLAHIGFYRLLEERGIPIDCIAGTSMGAMVAAAFAMGYSSYEALNVVNEHLIKGAKIDFTFPYISIASGKRASDSLRNIYGENKQIEDLWLNYFCVSTDLISQDLYVHERGLLWKSIRSSISLPFIYPPISLNGKLLMDGGILNNIPIDVMRQYSRGSRIIASNITNNNVFKSLPLPHFISGWKLLYNKCMGKKEILPLTLGELVLRLLTISSHHNTEKMINMADLCIFLKAEEYGLLDFKKFREIAELGYNQAKKQFTIQNIDELLKKH